MKLHRNAALSWSGRRRLAERVVLEGWTLRSAAEAAGVSVRCARKWVARYREQGEAGLADRSSAPRVVANRTPHDRCAVASAATTREAAPTAMASDASSSAGSTCTSPSTTTAGSPTRRCWKTRRRRPRSASSAARSPSSPATGSASSGYSPTTAPPIARRSTLSPAARSESGTCARGPTGPRPTAKAERFIRTLLNGWAYGAIYRSSSERTAALDGWLWHYNHRRRHSALGHQPPVSRLNGTNLLGTYS